MAKIVSCGNRLIFWGDFCQMLTILWGKFLKNQKYSKISRSCSSADEDDEEPGLKALREKERRQANNARER